MKTDVLGVGFDNTTVEDAARWADDFIAGGGRGYVVTPNPEVIWMSRSDGRLKSAIAGARLVLPDGVGVYLGARILGAPLRARAPGIDFVAALFALLAKRGARVYLLGGRPSVAQAAAENISRAHPGLVIAGVCDGYFLDDGPVVKEINSVAPDLLVVCLGAPRQEYWMADNIGRLNVGLCAGLGGALDVFSGRVKRAPAAWRKLGLEWLYRLIREPRRLWRMTKLPLFLYAVILRRITIGRVRRDG